MMETILFAWIFKMKKGWKEMNYAADLKLPKVFYFIIKYITPALLIIIFLAALIKPKNDNWSLIGWHGWELDKSSLIGKLQNKNAGYNHQWIADTLYAEEAGYFQGLITEQKEFYAAVSCLNSEGKEYGYIKKYPVGQSDKPLLSSGEKVQAGTPLMTGRFVNNALYISLARYYLALLFLILIILVSVITRKKAKNRNLIS
jgi:hypothetical protein